MIWFGRTSLLDPAIVEQIVWTLLHFLWQGLALALLFAAINFVLRKRSANVRYVVGCVFLALMALAPAVTFAHLGGRFDDPGPLVIRVAPPATAGNATVASTVTAAAQRFHRAVTPHVPSLLLGWFIGATLLALRQLGAWLWLKAVIRNNASDALRPEWERFVRLATTMGVRSVRFAESTLVTVPATAGWIRPIVLLPAAALMGIPADQLEALVAHELAHIRRHDYLVNLLQSVVETLLFFHPAVWWISYRVRQERENCCDDAAVAIVGDPLNYAEALTALAALRARAMPHYAMAATGRGKLWLRIGRIVGDPMIQLRRTTNRPAVGAAVLALAFVCFSCAYLFANAVSIRPQRETVDSVRALGDLIGEIAGDDVVNSRTLLPALDEAIASMNGGLTIDAAALDKLVDGIGTKDADALQREILARVHVADKFAYQKSLDWTHGSYVQRLQIIERLRTEAGRLHAAGDARRARRYALACVLLAAQDSFLAGWGPVMRTLNEQWFADASGLSDRQLARLRRHAQDHSTITRIYVHLRLEVEDHAAALKQSPAQPQRLASAQAALLAMARIGRARADVHWQTASLTRHLLQVSNDADRRRLLADPWLDAETARSPHLKRWLAQAAQSYDDGRGYLGVKPIKSNEVKRVTPAR